MERLQKLLARAGIASRRESEKLIREGRVTVDGQPARLGMKADPQKQIIAVDGQTLSVPSHHHYLAVHKPRGMISTRSDPQGRPTVMTLIPEPLRKLVYPVGRLDADSEGLMFLFDDGELAYRLMHPRFHVPKTYLVWAAGHVSPSTRAQLGRGIVLEDGLTAPTDVQIIEHLPNATLLQMTLYEGRKRQIRRMLAAVGHPVQRLIRVAIGNVELGDLPAGQWRTLTEEEIARLYQAVDKLSPDEGKP